MNNKRGIDQIQLSISNIGWDKADDEQMYEYLLEMGIKGLEIAPTRLWAEAPYDKLREAERYREQINKQYGLSISSMQSIWYGMNQQMFGTAKERKELLEYTKKAILFAEVLGCSNIVFGCPKSRNILINEDGQYDEEQMKIGMDFFRELGEFASHHSTCISIEPNPTIYQTNYINTTKEAIELVKEIDCKGFRINGDMGTIIYNEEKLNDFKENIALFHHFHISEPGLAQIKERNIHQQLVHLLNNENYRGYLSIEMKRLDNSDYLKEIGNVLAYVQKIMSSV